MTPPTSTGQPLDRYIDRFLFADGWRVTEVVTSSNPTMYAVTMTNGTGQVTRSASSAGEAAFMACSSARQHGQRQLDGID